MSDESLVTERPSLKQRALEELKTFLYITLYFWVLFLVFDLYRMSLRSEGVSIVDNGFALVNAFLLAKVALVTEGLYKRRRTRNVPLAYRVFAHSLLLSVVLIAFSLFEEGIKALFHGHALSEHLDAAGIALILARAGIFFVMLIPFCAFQELAQLLGIAPLVAVFFGRPAGKRYALVCEAKTDTE